MKKYIMPTVKVAIFNASAILAGSLQVEDTPTEQMLSKPRSIFGYEDEEDK